MATAKAKGPVVFKELTPEEQIAAIRKEAAERIKELEKQLPWEKRFANAFNQYTKNNGRTIANCIRGYKPDDYEFENVVNKYLNEHNFKLVYKSASFDNDIYNQSPNNISDYDLSEYPVYAVYEVRDSQQTFGYIKINCNYSSYNGNEYSGWVFVKPQQITCTIYNVYKP